MTFTLDKKGISIIATIGIMLILSFLGLTGVSLLGSASSAGLAYMQAQQSLYIAEAGLNWYMEQLQNDTDWSDNVDLGSVSFSNGSFSIDVTTYAGNQNLIDVAATGSITGYEGQPVKRVVSATLSRTLEAFDYALYIGGTLNTTGSTNFSLNGNKKESAANLPTVDFAYYKSIASPGQDILGNYTFSAGTYSGIWYIDGNATIDSNVTISGSVIATGNISMNGSTNITVSATSPYPALVANGNFHFQNTNYITVNGLVYVGANLSGNFLLQQAENITFNGTIIVAGNMNLQNSNRITISYNEGIITEPPPGFSGTSEAQVVYMVNWEEVLQ